MLVLGNKSLATLPIKFTVSLIVSPTRISPPSPALRYAVPSTRKLPLICVSPSITTPSVADTVWKLPDLTWDSTHGSVTVPILWSLDGKIFVSTRSTESTSTDVFVVTRSLSIVKSPSTVKSPVVTVSNVLGLSCTSTLRVQYLILTCGWTTILTMRSVVGTSLADNTTDVTSTNVLSDVYTIPDSVSFTKACV